MPRKQEKRTAARKSFKTRVTFETTAGKRRARAKDCTAIDISHSGIKLKTGQLLEEGSIVKLSIPIDGLKVALPIFAEVIWSKHELDSISMGLRFLG